MDEHTKRKLTVSGKLPYIFATTAPPYRLSGAVIVSYGSETGGQDWPAITNEERAANAQEFVRRWNAFEKDGLVDGLVAACDEGLAECERVKMDCKCKWKNLDSLLGRIERIEAAIAKAT